MDVYVLNSGELQGGLGWELQWLLRNIVAFVFRSLYMKKKWLSLKSGTEVKVRGSILKKNIYSPESRDLLAPSGSEHIICIWLLCVIIYVLGNTHRTGNFQKRNLVDDFSKRVFEKKNLENWEFFEKMELFSRKLSYFEKLEFFLENRVFFKKIESFF